MPQLNNLSQPTTPTTRISRGRSNLILRLEPCPTSPNSNEIVPYGSRKDECKKRFKTFEHRDDK